MFLVAFDLISPEFSYRPGLSALSEDASTNNASGQSAGGPPNRPLPPTPDDDDQQGDRTLIMKRVRTIPLSSYSILKCEKKRVTFAVCFSANHIYLFVARLTVSYSIHFIRLTDDD